MLLAAATLSTASKLLHKGTGLETLSKLLLASRVPETSDHVLCVLH